MGGPRASVVAAGAALAVLIAQASCGAQPDETDAPLDEPTVVSQVTATPPSGHLDDLTSPAAGFVTASGRITDLRAGAVAEIELGVDGEVIIRVPADGPRIERGTDATGDVYGYGIDAPAAGGDHEVCVSVAAPASGSEVPMGCDRIRIEDPTSDEPFVQITAITPHREHAIVDVRGIVGSGPRSTPAQVRIEVIPDTDPAFTITADVDQNTFRTQVRDLDDGRYGICVADPSGRSQKHCGDLVVGDLTVAVTDAPPSPTPVEPPVDHPLRDMRRDAGVSVRLSDDSVMWFFGDTSGRSNAGSVDYFVNNTAAWATASEPAETLDAADPASEPYEFVTPDEDFCNDAPYPKPVYWPESAVALPQPDGTDRVVLFVTKVCVAPGPFSFEGVGMAIVEVSYDPADPPAGRPIEGEVVVDELGTIDEPFGRASLLAPDGFVYLYHCGSLVEAHESCAVARTSGGSITDSSTWRYWNGGDWQRTTSWVSDRSASRPMTLSQGADVPIAAFTTKYDADREVFVMAYSPAPVFCDRIAVSFSRTPVGPWTPPLEIPLPGCDERVDDQEYACYAATAQPAFDRNGEIGLGYFDQFVAWSGGGAEYMACSAQITLVDRTTE